MYRRYPCKVDRERVITLDLLADPFAYTSPLPKLRVEGDWIYYGTITRNGVISALAWKAGSFGFSSATGIVECGMWDRMKIRDILEFHNSPGLEGRPTFNLQERWPIGCGLNPYRVDDFGKTR
ncbi:MAG TPA: hypothetical protein VGK80_06100 [Rhodanobacteraceae bacterium]